MKIVNLRMHQLQRLRELKIESGVFNSEAYMLILNRKQAKSKNGKKMVFKYLDCQDDLKSMARKIYTVEMLNSSDSYQEIEELVFPEIGVAVEQQMAGFALELIENHINVGRILNDDSIPLDIRLPYVLQLGTIIDKVMRVDDTNFKMQFGDLNEYNVILDNNDNMKIIDLDSAYVGQDAVPNSPYYLLKNQNLENLSQKYTKNRNGVYIPTDNTDMYCYTMIALDALAKEDMFKHSIPTYYMYLNHLKDVGVDKELIKIFEGIYLPVDNENPMSLLKKIDTTKEKEMSFDTFHKEYKKSLKS